MQHLNSSSSTFSFSGEGSKEGNCLPPAHRAETPNHFSPSQGDQQFLWIPMPTPHHHPRNHLGSSTYYLPETFSLDSAAAHTPAFLPSQSQSPSRLILAWLQSIHMNKGSSTIALVPHLRLRKLVRVNLSRCIRVSILQRMRVYILSVLATEILYKTQNKLYKITASRGIL